MEDGHTTGNHTYNHLNGWKTKDDVYLNDIAEAANYIDSNLFRPPYGRITSFQAKNLKAAMKEIKAKIIMWDVLSGDFDTSTITKEQCLENVILNTNAGSIIVFHDSEKAFSKLEYAFTQECCNFFQRKGYRFERFGLMSKKWFEVKMKVFDGY